MKRNSAILALVIIIVLGGGAYALFHKSGKPANTSTTSSKSDANAPAVNNAVLITKTSPSLGQYLAEPDGQALYTYGSDSSGVSNCTGSCLASWPAYQATGSTANLPAGVGVIMRSDNGQTQYTYNGMPLYTFVSDSKGQVTGDGVSNFNVAKPAAPASASQSGTSGSTDSSSNPGSGNSYNY